MPYFTRSSSISVGNSLKTTVISATSVLNCLLKLQAAFVKAVAQLKQYKLHLWRYNASLNVKEIKITPIARFSP